jgi:aromatic ring-opening dioxygenase catalytic subunit (LigB family)
MAKEVRLCDLIRIQATLTIGDIGWDHGVFIPMLLINPAADIPIVQLSVLSSESPSSHYEMGRALARLRDSNIAIIGSGAASFHNLNLLFSGVTSDAKFKSKNTEWSRAVTHAVLEKDAAEREKLFKGWRAWPGGDEMHPRGGGEHFMPLIVCAGAGGDQVAETYTDDLAGVEMFSYYWT